MRLPTLPLLVLDTETTGFVPVIHRVIEYACAMTKDGKVTKEYEQLLSIEKNDVPLVVQVLTRIRPQDLEGKPTFGDIFKDIEAMVTPDTVIVGQNIPFDLRMLKGEGWDMTEFPWIDTAMLASIVFPELKSYSLGYMSDALKLTHEPRHRALGDVRATLQMLGHCTERLESLPAADLEALKAIAARGPAGYRKFFESLESSKKKKRPEWLSLKKHKDPAKSDRSVPATKLPSIDTGSVGLTEESFSPETLNSLIVGARKGTIIAVKNLDAVLRRLEIPEDVTVLPSADALISKEAKERFLMQQAFTADEMTLAMKLFLYDPAQKTDFPIHGDEYSVWSAKLAASSESPEYLSRRKKIGKETVITTHHELVTIAASPDMPRAGLLTQGVQIIIDDASMLEDSATAALGWTCLLSTLRAAAAGHDHLTKCTDLIELWAEKVRNGMDLRYLAPSDLGAPEIEHLQKMLTDLLATDLPHAARRALSDLQLILQEKNLQGRITWIESFMDGSKAIKSVPEKIADVLASTVYTRASTHLLTPKGAAGECEAIVPSSTKSVPEPLAALPVPPFTVELPIGITLDTFLRPTSGKTVILVGSKRTIEDLYIKNAEDCEDKGITLLCQGMSGGQSRMQAEFSQAKAPAVMITTAWTYETMELPAGTVDTFVMQVLPFDHPSHPVFSRRALRYREPFNEYSLLRLKHRLFRLVRTFVRHSAKNGTVIVLDDRVRTKPYGKQVSAYLSSFAPSPSGSEKTEQMPLL